jgi:methylated-DNA-protein-cysteine methyltransferase-like protein
MRAAGRCAVVTFSYDSIYRVVRRIPAGRVATYGQVANLAGYPRHARQVGYALAALREESDPVPWHRVVNAAGEISARSVPGYEDYQRILLEEEGVVFNDNGRIPLAQYQWRPDAGASG